MKSFYTLLILLIPFVGFGQLNSPELISNSGGSFSNGGYHIDFSIGEIATEQLGNGIILTQGLNRQIRRMCEVLGFRVTKLKRIRIMDIHLDTNIGEYRDLNDEEIKQLSNQK